MFYQDSGTTLRQGKKGDTQPVSILPGDRPAERATLRQLERVTEAMVAQFGAGTARDLLVLNIEVLEVIYGLCCEPEAEK